MRNLFIIIALLSATVSIQAQRFEDYFEDRTLRLDYTFAGSPEPSRNVRGKLPSEHQNSHFFSSLE